MTNDMIALVANVALTLSFIVALIFGSAQVRAAADLLRDPEVDEIRDLLAAYCPSLGSRSEVW